MRLNGAAVKKKRPRAVVQQELAHWPGSFRPRVATPGHKETSSICQCISRLVQRTTTSFVALSGTAFCTRSLNSGF